MKKLMTMLLIVAMVLASTVIAFGQTVGTPAEGKGTITVENASKGQQYGVVKIFDATIGEDNAISYKGPVPSALSAYFEQVGDVETGYVKIKDGVDQAAMLAAVQAYAKTLNPTMHENTDGKPMVFEGLDYGYYAIISDMGSVVSIDSTMPTAKVFDKNESEPELTKEVEKESYSIGDTVKYTATFKSANFLGSGEDAKQVVEYVIHDTLPEFLSNAKITSIKIGEATYTGITYPKNFSPNEEITIPWATKNADKTYTSIYDNGAEIEIKYEATLTSVTNINTADTNRITVDANVDDGDGGKEPWDENWEDTAEIKTYAAALKKVDGSTPAKPLKGAQFTIKGLTVTGSAGEYTVVSYNSAANAPESAVLDTNDDGVLYILGLASDVKLVVTEYKAPDGYNKLSGTKELTPQLMTTKLYKESGQIKYDADGNVIASSATATTTETVEKNLSDLEPKALVIVNQKGTEMPSTGGIGTTILYTLGGILVVGAGVLLVARRKMDN